MSWISLISFIICATIIIASFRSKSDIFSPGRVFGFVWALTLGLTDLKLSGLQHEWSLEIWIQVLIGPIAFLIGVAVVYVINLKTEVHSLDYLRNNEQLYEIDKSKLYKVVIILFSLFLLGYIIIYLKTNEIPLFSSKPGKARANFTMFGIGLFLHNVVLIVFFSCVYFITEKKNKLRKSILALLSLLAIVLYALTLQRYQIFMAILMVTTLFYYTTHRIKYKTVLISGLILIIFFYLVSSFRAGEIVIFVLYKMSKMKFSQDYAIFTEPYMYVVMNLENYARSIAKVEHFTYGYYTFDFMTAITGLKHWIDEYFSLVETPFLTSSYNTYSAFWTYYRDFGVLGIFMIPLIGGMTLSSMYYSFKVKPTLMKLAIFGMFLFAVIFSFFNNAISYLWFVYNLFALIIVLKYISLSKTK
ncbi:MAG: O-antigen polymerase [Melioribacteraceae bacterium]